MSRKSAFPPEASRRVGFTGNRIDRQSENRPPDALETARARGDARYFLFVEDRVLVDVGCQPILPPMTLEAARTFGLVEESVILLGWRDGVPLLAGTATVAIDALPDTVKAIDLRSLAGGGAVSADDLGAVAQARSFLLWHETHGFCATCGAKSEMALGGHRRDCPACGRFHFPRTDPVVIMLAIGGDHCLMGRQGKFVDGMYSALAGFMEPGETIEDAVRRETFEESGIRLGAVRYHASQPWPFPSSLMIACHGEALSSEIDMDAEELQDCRWFSRDEASQMLERSHPDGLVAPFPFAIAHELIRAFVEKRTGFD